MDRCVFKLLNARSRGIGWVGLVDEKQSRRSEFKD